MKAHGQTEFRRGMRVRISQTGPWRTFVHIAKGGSGWYEKESGEMDCYALPGDLSGIELDPDSVWEGQIREDEPRRKREVEPMGQLVTPEMKKQMRLDYEARTGKKLTHD